MESLTTIDFNTEERELICSIINIFGDGQHPYCDDTTFHGFYISYLKELINSTQFESAKDNLTTHGQEILTKIIAKI